MMNSEIKEKWLKALRSGEYKQGRRMLRSMEDKYCCLGVLCDILGEEWTQISIGHWGINDREGSKENYINTVLPSDEVWKKAGMWDESKQCGDQMVAGGQNLSGMNDHGASFEEIAEAIERYL